MSRRNGLFTFMATVENEPQEISTKRRVGKLLLSVLVGALTVFAAFIAAIFDLAKKS